jgi:curli biogenesis system outer membrane secretion channel CsgG
MYKKTNYMRKNLFLLIALISMINGVSMMAQEKIVVSIPAFSYVTGNADPKDVATVQDEVINAFVKTKRFDIVDRGEISMAQINEELEVQKGENFIDGNVVAQGKSLGAQYLIMGAVPMISVTEGFAKDNQGRQSSTGWTARVLLSLRVVDLETGKIISSQAIEPKSGGVAFIGAFVNPKSRESALNKALKDIEGQVDMFVLKNFPVTLQIVEFQGKQVLISGGSEKGIKKGMKFTVAEPVTVEVDGKPMTRNKEVGQLEVAKVEDENFSLCKIKSGEKEIRAKFESNPNSLKIILNAK